ncbi:MAG: hypothetical protein IT317_06010 [Anaerolineales bacterium]|nr:hypothetical protein [Anaerolineales bacterium]
MTYRFGPLALLLSVLLAACGGNGPAPTSAPPQPTPVPVATQAGPPTAAPAGTAAPLEWQVEIVQDGAVLPNSNGTVTAARAPFTIRVRLPSPLPVKLNAAATDANFQALQPGFVFTEDCLLALCTGMDAAEDRLNPDQALFVDPELTHYLYYLAPEDHRWSRAEVTAQGATFERDVAYLNSIAVAESTDPALYLLFFVNAANEQQIDSGELQKITLAFAPAS